MEMGLKDGFDAKKANFSKMGSCIDGSIYINSVIHKTFISVDSQGTKAGAVTDVDVKCGAMATIHHILELLKGVNLKMRFTPFL